MKAFPFFYAFSVHRHGKPVYMGGKPGFRMMKARLFGPNRRLLRLGQTPSSDPNEALFRCITICVMKISPIVIGRWSARLIKRKTALDKIRLRFLSRSYKLADQRDKFFSVFFLFIFANPIDVAECFDGCGTRQAEQVQHFVR